MGPRKLTDAEELAPLMDEAAVQVSAAAKHHSYLIEATDIPNKQFVPSV